MSFSGIKGSRDLVKATYDIQGTLEQARTLAMATDTYTWVGFFEEDPSNPGVAGTGQVVLSLVSSSSGTNPEIVGSPIAQLPSSALTQVAKVMKIPNTHLATVPSVAVTRPSITAATPAKYQIGSGSFANTTTFSYPLTGTAQYTFSQIIQFSPQGDATRIGDYPTQVMEVGLQPAHGNTTGATGTNFAVIQVTGIGGPSHHLSPMTKRNPSISGFSLVEVSLALGVVVFCLVTIFGRPGRGRELHPRFDHSNCSRQYFDGSGLRRGSDSQHNGHVPDRRFSRGQGHRK